MKRIALILVSAVSLLLSACTKDTSVSLNGTKWRATTMTDSIPVRIDLSFRKSGKSDFTMTFTSYDEKMTMHGWYSYAPPKVTLNPVTTVSPDGTVIDQTGIVYHGTVDGGKMTMIMGKVSINFSLK